MKLLLISSLICLPIQITNAMDHREEAQAAQSSETIELVPTAAKDEAVPEFQKPLVIGELYGTSLEKHKNTIDYHPEVGSDHTKWREAIQQFKPKTVLFGTNIVDAEMLAFWRSEVPDGELYLIRRGVALARVDLKAAEKLNVNYR
ncbi:unnamed protein product [marine sediment metagenome]|uniref:Uncharacterized protein n=1 Tax=marine sediment metagenome TaxID=412755 RepID=X1ELJ7_9ZZZZ